MKPCQTDENGLPEKPYRPDIDGLRAFAVLAVIGFHAFPDAFPGGFVGVDVFFVISGYLITGIILKGCLAGNFSFSNFYARRIRRIFPALLTVLVAVLIAGYFLCFADEFSSLGLHTVAGVFFFANVSHLMAAGDYFAPAADHQPLLHLWSLGIEEQFYLAWPLVLLLLAKRPGMIARGILLLFAASFIFNIFGVQGYTEKNFYLPFGRVWELLAGSALVVWEIMGKAKPGNIYAGSNHALSITGAVLLILALWGLDREIPFPGFAALLPVAGAVCMMAAGPQAVLNRLWLSRKVWVGIGIISFPLYLWHWPLLAFPRLIAGGEVSVAWRSASVLLSFLLAWLTYRCVEKKLRFHPWKNMPWLLLAAGSGIALLASVAYYGKGLPERFEFTRKEQIQQQIWNNTPGCVSRFGWKHQYCQYFSMGDPKRWVLFLGDSHVHVLAQTFPESKSMGLMPNTGLVALGHSICPGWRWWVDNTKNGCYSFDEPFSWALEHGIEQVVITGRYSAYYNGAGFGVDSKDIRPWFSFGPPNQPSVDEGKAAFSASLRATLDAWRAQGKEVIFVHQVPELGFNPVFRDRPLAAYVGARASDSTILRSIVEARQRGYRQAVAEILKDYPEVRVFDPMDDLCDEKYCYVIKNGVLLYHDDDHVNYYGSQLLLKRLIPFLQESCR
jgi:peptidoglycan/LPS O-acetylase OafA/YrhL